MVFTRFQKLIQVSVFIVGVAAVLLPINQSISNRLFLDYELLPCVISAVGGSHTGLVLQKEKEKKKINA